MAAEDLKNVVRASPVETTSGLVLLIAGGALNLAVQDPFVRFLGYVVSAVGTLLLSWALTRAWVSRQQDDAIARTLRAVGRQLSTATSQLNQALYRSLEEESQVPTEVLESSVQHLFGVLSELQLIIGSPIGVEDVVAIKGRLDMLGEELTAAWHEPEVAEGGDSDGDVRVRLGRALDEIQGIKQQLDTLLLKGRTSTAESPAPIRQKGSISIRRDCPVCRNQVPLTVRRDGATTQVRYCLSCFTKLSIDPAGTDVAVMQEATAPLEGTLRMQGSIPFVTCPTCAQARKAIAGRDGTYYAVCPTDDRLVRGIQPPRGKSRLTTG